MLKKIAKNIILIYLSCFVFLASIAIPYSAHTCFISKSTHLVFLDQKDSCLDLSNKASSKSSFQKSACCAISNGIIDVDAELILASIQDFIPDLATQIVYFYLNYQSNFTHKSPSYTAASIPPDVPLRILQQSFLC